MKRIPWLGLVLGLLLFFGWLELRHREALDQASVDALVATSALASDLRLAQVEIDETLRLHAADSIQNIALRASSKRWEQQYHAAVAKIPAQLPPLPAVCQPCLVKVAAQAVALIAADSTLSAKDAEIDNLQLDNTRLAESLVTVRGLVADSADALGQVRKQLTNALTKKGRSGLKKYLPGLTIGKTLVSLSPTRGIEGGGDQFNVAFGWKF